MRDGGPGPRDTANSNPRIWGDNFLRSEINSDLPRYSVNSIPFYIFGTLDVEYDGVDGPGYTEPLADGTFTRRGREYPPRLDISVDPARVKTNPADPLDVIAEHRVATPQGAGPLLDAIAEAVAEVGAQLAPGAVAGIYFKDVHNVGEKVFGYVFIFFIGTTVIGAVAVWVRGRLKRRAAARRARVDDERKRRG